MRSQLLLIFFLSISLFSNAQDQVYVKVFNQANQQSLAFANIFLETNQVGDASDLDGLAVLKLPDQYSQIDVLQCSYIGFRDTVIEVNLIRGDTIFLPLRQEAIELDAVEVSAEQNNYTGAELVKQAIKNIKRNYSSKTQHLEILYRELMYEESKCVLMTEALSTLQYTKYPQKGFTKKAWRMYWNKKYKKDRPSSWVCGKMVHFGTPQFFKYYNTVDDLCRINAIRKTENWTSERRDAIMQGGPLGVSAADKVKYLTDFLDPKLSSKYTFTRDGATQIDSHLCLIVRFKPRPAFKNVHQPWDKKIGFAFYSGTLYLNIKDFAIVKFECQMANSARTTTYKYTHPWQEYPTQISISTRYIKGANEKWRLHHIRINQLHKGKLGTKWEHENDFEGVRELFVYEVNSNPDKLLDKSDDSLFRDIEGMFLQNTPQTYDPEIWSRFEQSGRYPELSKKDFEALSEEQELKTQFLSTSE